MDAVATSNGSSQPKTRLALWRNLLSPYLGVTLLLLVAQAGQALASLLIPAFSAELIDFGILNDDSGYVLTMSGVLLAAAVGQLLFGVAIAWLGSRIAMSFGRDLRSAVFSHVQGFSLTELRKFGAPSLITRTTNDVLQIQNILGMVLIMMLMAPFMGVGALIMAVRQDAELSLVLVVAVPLLVLLVWIIFQRALPLFSRMQGKIDQVNRILREQISGLQVIRAFVRDDYEQHRFGGANDDLANTAIRVGRLMAILFPAVSAIMQFSSIAVIWLAAPRIEAGVTEVGTLVAFLSYIAQVLMSVMMASMLFAMAPRALVSAGRVREVLLTPTSVTELATPVVLAAPDEAPGEVEFDEVTFAYPGAEEPVLRNISFRIAPGETVAAIGSTGSGKSTLLNLIPRLFDVVSGAVRVNGVDVRDVALDDLWRRIGLVPQEAYLFTGTIAANLRYGRAEADDAALWHALEIAQARDFVEALPGKLEAPVAQGGDNFSGGQRQRLTIARALVRRPAIYLFDDSFSALDFVTEARLRAALAADRRADAATLIVGQRVNSLRQAHRILVVEKGELVASGTHEALLTQSPTYREIASSQQAAEVAG